MEPTAAPVKSPPMKLRLVTILLLASLAGCAHSYRRSYSSPLVSVYTPSGDRDARWEVEPFASWIDDAVVQMAGDFDVPLQLVIPVRVYHQSDPSTGRSYYNRFTGSIVLRGTFDPGVFAHELSHLLVHHVDASAPYWSDQALAEYMETRYYPFRPAAGSDPVAARQEDRREKLRRLIHRIADAREPQEVLDHLTPRAIDEERGWGVVVVRYLFEERWKKEELREKVRRLLALGAEETARVAPEIVAYCRRPTLLTSSGLSDSGPPPAR